MKKQQYKFLTKSILLEETGIPYIHTITITVITSILFLFILWANFMIVEDTISIVGNVLKNSSSSHDFEFVGQVPSKDIAAIHLEDKVNISITGVTRKNKILGQVLEINKEPIIATNGRVYYEIIISPSDEDLVMNTLSPQLYDQMEMRFEIIVGKRTLLQYYLGPLWEARS